MSALYLAKAQSAYEKIKMKGTLITITRRTLGTYDELTDTIAGESEATFQAPAVVLGPTTQTEQTYADQFQSGALVRSRVRKLLMAGLRYPDKVPFVLQEDDTFTFGGYEWSSLGFKGLNPDEDVVVLYEVTVNR